jgi:phenylacetate-CoA ligase
LTEKPALGRTKSYIDAIDWPPILTGDGAVLAALLHQLEETQWTGADEIRERQHEQLVVLARHCAKHSRYFRARLERAKLKPDNLGTPDGLAKLPVLGRRDIQTAGAELFCAEVPPSHLPASETRTSGSTGEPVMVRRTAISTLFWAALAMRDHLWHGRDFRRRLVAVRATIRKTDRRDDWGPPANLIYRTGPSLGVPSGLELGEMLELLLNFQPDNLLIYPNLLEALTRYCREREIRLPNLRHLRTTGETLSPQLRKEAAACFNAAVEDTYSSQELGYVAVQCPLSGLYHVMAESVIVEVLDESGRQCREGEVGRLVVTDLHNFATPLIRYDIADYAEVGGPCPCGRGLPTLTRILGRERNLMLMPDGSRQWPRTGFTGFRDFAPIQQFQFIQLDLGTVEVRFVSETPVSPKQEAALRAHIQKFMGHPFELRFVYFPDRIPRGANGKFEDFVCQATVQGS